MNRYIKYKDSREIDGIIFESDQHNFRLEIGQELPFSHVLTASIVKQAHGIEPLLEEEYNQTAEIRALNAAKESLEKEILQNASIIAEIEEYKKQLLQRGASDNDQ